MPELRYLLNRKQHDRQIAIHRNKRKAGCKVNQTLIDNLRFVLQNMRLQPGDMAKVQADIVAQAIGEILSMGCRIEELQHRLLHPSEGR